MIKYAEGRFYLLPHTTCQYLDPLQQRTSANTCGSLALDTEVLSPHSISFPSLGWNATRHSSLESSETFAPGIASKCHLKDHLKTTRLKCMW